MDTLRYTPIRANHFVVYGIIITFAIMMKYRML